MKENQKTTVEEGAGYYDFSQFEGINLEQEEQEEDTEPKFNVINEQPEEEQEQGEEVIEEEKVNTQEDLPEEAQEEIEQEQQQAQISSNYSTLAKKYVDSGLWNDGAIEVDGEPVPISKLKNLDEDTFLQIEEAQRRKKNAEIEEKYVNTEDLDDVSRQILEITKNGGNVTELLNVKKSMIDPLDTYDLNNEVHQEALVRHMYKAQNQGLSDNQINKLIESDKDEMVLDTKAEKFVTDVRQSYKLQLEKEAETAAEAQENEKKSLRDLKKNLKQELKDLGMKTDSFLNPILQAATHKTKDGFAVDSEFQEMKKDPKIFAEYLAWKYDRENFFKSTVSKLSRDRDNKQLELLDIKPTSGSNKPERKEREKSKSEVEKEFLANIRIESNK